MSARLLSRGILIALITAVLVTPARPASLDTDAKLIVTGIVVVSAGVAVVVTVLVLHHKHKTTMITGCVRSGASGMTLTDENNGRSYVLSGELLGIKTGDRMSLEGNRNDLFFKTRRITADLGACRP